MGDYESNDLEGAAHLAADAGYDDDRPTRAEAELDDWLKSSPHTEAMANIAANMAPDVMETIRRDERMRVARLLSDSRFVLADFAKTPGDLVDLIAFMLTLGS